MSSRCVGLCGVLGRNHQVRKISLCISQFFLSEQNFTSVLSRAWEVKVALSLLRIPLTKHKSMREALREKGIELPYQDPALKYQTYELAGSANMYINNYIDV